MSASRSRIASRDNATLVRVRKLLAAPDAYRKLGVVWLEGDHLIRAARARGWHIDEMLVAAAREHEPSLQPLLRDTGRLRVVDDNLWSGLGSLISKAPIAALAAWPGPQPIEPGAATVVLDRVQDAGNLGSMLRSAAAFGVAQVIALKGCAAVWSPKVLRAGMGAHFGLRLIEAVDESALDALQIPLVVTSSHAGESIATARLPSPCAWVFGHEGQGVTASLLQRAALRLAIPMPGGEESLNVAAAAAVCLYESARRCLEA
ncbi:MAG: RNA methyltransferase [Burkholderiaceae bacterium]|nr:RNA methyltransferase [Burkholderiaceae bacterium]